MVSELPLSGDSLDHDFLIENRPPIAPGDEPSLETRSILGDYFHAMKIPLRLGRDFEPLDFADNAPLVGIANDAMVRQYFANEDPLGKRVRWARDPELHWMTIVGVVGDVKHFGLDLPEEPALILAVHADQSLETLDDSGRAYPVETRTRWPRPSSNRFGKLTRNCPSPNSKRWTSVSAASFAARRFNMLLLGIFAGLALVLAAVGIYGVMSYAVTQRTQEIGIRMALGARATDVLKLIIRNGMTLTLLGVVIGVAGAIASDAVACHFAVWSDTRPTSRHLSPSRRCWSCLRCWLVTFRRAERRRSIRWWRWRYE